MAPLVNSDHGFHYFIHVIVCPSSSGEFCPGCNLTVGYQIISLIYRFTMNGTKYRKLLDSDDIDQIIAQERNYTGCGSREKILQGMPL